MYLDNLGHPFKVIGITETWMNASNVDSITIKGYNHELMYRSNKIGGGVSVFVKNNLNYIRRTDLEINDEFVETVIIEVDKNIVNMNRKILIVTLYRPPNSDIQSFIERIEQILQTVRKERAITYCIGDYNINLFNVDTHKTSANFLDCMYSYGFFPVINKPTRITTTSATLIDNIFCNGLNDTKMFNGLLLTDISDHLPLFCIINHKLSVEGPSIIYKRQITDVNINKFISKVSDANWCNVFESDNCQNAYTEFYTQFKKHYDDSFPLKKLCINYRNRKSWLTEGLKNSIKTKNKLYVKSLKEPTLSNIKRYKEYRNKLNHILRKTEREHYASLIEMHRFNLCKTWNILKEVINKNKMNIQTSRFCIKNKIVTNEETIAEAFNDFYVNIGRNLSKTIPNVDNIVPESYITQENRESIYLKPTDKEEVESVIIQLKDSSAGYDDIVPKVVKLSYTFYLEALVHIFNLSITQGIFPNELKIAKVVPLFKKGDKSVISNYRPISLLPLFSKVLEKLIYCRIANFINKHELLYKYQFGFRNKHNTNMALITITDKIMNYFQNGDYVVGLFLDFSKAFDTVNHNILLSKLNKYGIRGVAQNLMASYLGNRVQYVYYGTSSSKKNITCGVPQGSILGPLLFLLYINDIVNVSKILLPILYADDTNLFLNGKSISQLIKTLNNELINLVKWLNANKLSLNVDKTHYMIFSSKNKKVQVDESLKVTINNVEIERVHITKFLGVLVDDKLNWKQHVSYIKGKVSKAVGILCKARKVLNENTLVTLYNSLLYPYLTYCIEVWGSCNKTELNAILKLQKRALRIIASANYKAHTNVFFKKYKILNIYQIHDYCILLFMFKFHKCMLPSLFQSMFTYVSNAYNTRQLGRLCVPLGKSTTINNTIRFIGVKLWNTYINIIDNNCTINTFKKKLKSYLLNVII